VGSTSSLRVDFVFAGRLLQVVGQSLGTSPESDHNLAS